MGLVESVELAETAVMVLIAVQAETVEPEAPAVRLELRVRHVAEVYHIAT